MTRALLAALALAAPAAAQRFAAPPEVAHGALALVGDLQRTLWMERLIGREQNDAERAAIVADLAAARPGLLVVLGDATSDGDSRSAWQEFDELMAPVRAAGIPALLVPGNHDCWGREPQNLQNAGARFANFANFAKPAARWSMQRWGGLALVLLDSNDGPLGAARWAAERAFYEAALARLDGDAEVRGVLVLMHHPPFTNSKTTGDELEVQRAFLPAFFAAKKTLALITGHAHGYERFEERGKAFVVSGGGGGPRVKLLAGSEARHRDRFAGPSPRPFNWVLLEEDAGGVRATVRGLDKGEQKARVLERFTLPFAR